MQRLFARQLVKASKSQLCKALLSTPGVFFSLEVRSRPQFRKNFESNPDTKFNAPVESWNSAKAGFMQLNHTHRHNILSKGYLEEIARHLEYLVTDNHVRAIWVDTKKPGDNLSRGLDLKYIYYELAKNKNSEVVYEYLKTFYEFVAEVARINKPLLVSLEGDLKNASGAFFLNANMPISRHNSRLQFNETGLGGIPDSGASFYLSRIPGEVGTYLALTGDVLEGEEIYHAGLSIKHSDEPKTDLQQLFSEYLLAYEPHKSSFYEYGQKFKENWMNRIKEKLQSKAYMIEEYKDRITNAENPESLKMLVAEMVLKNKSIEHANYYNNIMNEIEYFKFNGQTYTNHLESFREGVLSKLPGVDVNSEVDKLPFPRQKIDKCFKFGTIEEIFNALEQEGSEWAHTTLEKLKTKSPLSLKLTLKLLRNGKKMSWKDCLEQEFRVSFRRFHDKEYQDSIEHRLIDAQRNFDQWEFKTFDSITDAQVENYFAPIQKEFGLPEYNSSVQQNSLHPVRYFCESYPEIIRTWVNEESLKDITQRIDYNEEVRDYLRQLGIDVRNPSLQPSTVRNALYNLEKYKRKVALAQERVQEIASNRKAIRNYQQERKDLIESFFSDEQKTKAYIDKTVENFFVKKFNERKEEYFTLSQRAHRYKRRHTYSKLRDIIGQSRLLKTQHSLLQDFEKSGREISQNAGVPLFFPQNPYQSFLDVPNPEVTLQHPYIKYREQIGIKNTLSPEFYEEYLTGKVPHLVATDIEYPEQFANVEVDNSIQAGQFVNTDYGKDPKTEQRNRDYVMQWGKPEEVADYEANRALRVQEILLEFDSHTSMLAEADPKIKEQILKYDPRDRGTPSKVKASVETIFPQKAGHQKEQEERAKIATNLVSEIKSFDESLQTSNFVDLNLAKRNDLHGLAFNTNKESGDRYWEQLNKTIRIDPQISECFDKLFSESALNSKTEAVQQFSNKLKDMLLSIYSQKVNEVLKDERPKYQNIRPLFTRDDQSILSKKTFETEDQKYMESVDDYIFNNVNFEFHNFISAHVFFSFSYIGLSELEITFNKLLQIRTLIQSALGPSTSADGRKAVVQQISSLLRVQHINIQGEAQLEELLEYLGTSTKMLAQLYILYKDKIHFHEDRILDTYHSIKTNVKEKTNTGNRQQTDFMQTAIQQQGDALNKEKVTMSMMDLPFPDDSFKNNMLRKGLAASGISVNNDLTNVEKESVLYLLGYAKGLAKERAVKSAISGVSSYVWELDAATKKAIYGKDNAIPHELLRFSESSEIPDYFPEFDAREPAQVWVERKTEDAIERLFNARETYEKNLSKEDLLALDHSLVSLLTPSNIKDAVVQELNGEVSKLGHLLELRELEGQEKNNQLKRVLIDSWDDLMVDERKVKNHKALERYHSYALALKSRKDDGSLDKLARREIEFERRYLRELRAETLVDPEEAEFFKSIRASRSLKTTEQLSEKEIQEQKIRDFQNAQQHSLNEELKLSLRSIIKESDVRNRILPLKDELKAILRRSDLLRLTSHRSKQ